MDLENVLNFETLEKILDACNDGILITDPNLIDNPIIYCNKTFCEMTGYDTEEVLGQNCRFLQNSDTDQNELDLIRESIANLRNCKAVLRNYRKDGSLFWNQLSLSPVIDEKGDLIYFIGIQSDVTSEKEIEKEMNILIQRIKDSLT